MYSNPFAFSNYIWNTYFGGCRRRRHGGIECRWEQHLRHPRVHGTALVDTQHIHFWTSWNLLPWWASGSFPLAESAFCPPYCNWWLLTPLHNSPLLGCDKPERMKHCWDIKVCSGMQDQFYSSRLSNFFPKTSALLDFSDVGHNVTCLLVATHGSQYWRLVLAHGLDWMKSFNPSLGIQCQMFNSFIHWMWASLSTQKRKYTMNGIIQR